MIQIYHNPRCGKSRNCVAYISDKKLDTSIIKYLETPPTVQEIKDILLKLNFKPIQLVRVKESIWIENYKNKVLSSNELIEIMSKNPILIERPIVIKGNKAVVARPIEKSLEII